jgi:hypothetical protein
VQPFAVAVDAHDNVIVTDPGEFLGESRLVRIDAGVGASIRHEGDGGFNGVAVEPTDNLIVTSDIAGRQQLPRFHPVSEPPTVVSRIATGLTGGVAVETTGPFWSPMSTVFFASILTPERRPLWGAITQPSL